MLTVRCARSPTQVEEISVEEAAGLLSRPDVALWFDLNTPTQAELEF